VAPEAHRRLKAVEAIGVLTGLGNFLKWFISRYDHAESAALASIRKDLKNIMADLKATRDELKALVPIVEELAGDIKELDAKVTELQQNSDPATIQEIADLTASLKGTLRKAADVVPEADIPTDGEPTEPEPPAEPTGR
jgi:septal ring factor EnvC (AmiA/AmiB activator)